MPCVAVVLWMAYVALVTGLERHEMYHEMIRNGVDYETFRSAIKEEQEMLKEMENRRGRDTVPVPSDQTRCKIVMTAPTGSETEADPMITTYVECEDTVLHDATTKLSELKPTKLDHGIQLYWNSPYGATYVYLAKVSDVVFVESEFRHLPNFPNRELVAPIVAKDGNFKFIGCKVENNIAGKTAGGMIIGGKANAELLNCDFYANEGEVGAVRLRDSAQLHAEKTVFELNQGKIVGALMAEAKSYLTAQKLEFYDNVADDRATAVYCTGKVTGYLDESFFYGKIRDDDFYQYLLDKKADPNKIEDYKLPKTGAIELDGKTFFAITGSEFKNNSATHGAVATTGSAVTQIRDCRFQNNAALNGAGVFVQGERGSYARVMDVKFYENIARNGGALVVSGNGTFIVDACEFVANAAVNGGAVWGDYSNLAATANTTCAKASQGSRVDIQESKFERNSARAKGGAFFIKCTDIRTNLSTFTQNTAEEDGGCMLAEETYDLHFIDSKFDQNTAGGSGGTLFVKSSHDVVSERCNFTNSNAVKAGGAISSVNGHGVIMIDSVLENNAAAEEDGGAVYSMDVEEITAQRSAITKNAAGLSGGALSVHNLKKLHLEGVDLSDNQATTSGGAVRASNGQQAIVQNVTITQITASNGPVSLIGMGDVSVSGIDFHHNEALDRCGALEVDGASSVQLKDLKFRENTAGSQGGGLCLSNAASAVIEQSIFDKNSAQEGGGAVVFKTNEQVKLSFVAFTNNFGAQGGAVKGTGKGSFLVEDSTFESNEARKRGAAFYAERSSLEIQRSTFSNNYVGDEKVIEKVIETNGTAGSESSVDNSGSKESGGVVYVGKAVKFKSMDSNYTYNEAMHVGGALMLEDIDEASIQYDLYLNGSAQMSGGCIYAANVRQFSLQDSSLQYCSAEHGGAFILEGASTASGGYNHFNNNTASSGGAFLCKGASVIKMEATNFSYNAANEGSSVALDCRCDIDFHSSAFYRDGKVKDNGGIFHRVKGCGDLNLNDCKTYGDKKGNGMNTMRYTVIGCVLGIMLCFLVTIIVARRRRSKKKQQEQGDIESGASAPLIPPRHKQPQQKLSFSEDLESSEYTTETEDDEEYTASEEHSEIEETKKGKKKAVAPPVKDEATDESWESSEEEEVVEKRERAFGGRPEIVTPFAAAVTQPIGVRNPKETRAAARRRQASVDMLNDGAGPSVYSSEDVLPPALPEKLRLKLSMSAERESPAAPTDPKIEEVPEEDDVNE